jgi:Methane oxygenase PmoA
MSRPGNNATRPVAIVVRLTVGIVAVMAVSEAFGLVKLAGEPVAMTPVAQAFRPAGEVTVTPNEAAKRVDIAFAGKPFTSYLWDPRLKKTVLYPLRSANGTLVTRGWPLDPRPGERVDHPHHIGLWFNYGNVNGLDFWNNSDTIRPADAPKMGTIVHRAIVKAQGGAETGTLITDMDWVDSRGTVLLRERATFVFRGDDTMRSVERVTRLTAAGQRVVFTDNKEGLFGMRVARQLEHPSKTAEVFTDASGKATAVPLLDNTGITGMYVSSEGNKGDDVWGTRGRWTMLGGRIGERPVTLAMLDHPANPGFPTHWHARGYGLFAANPLGQASLTEGRQPAFNLTLEPNASATFRYRLLIIDGAAATDSIEREARAFAGDQTSER